MNLACLALVLTLTSVNAQTIAPYTAEEQYCSTICSGMGYCCNDKPFVSSEFFLSCAQACLIRARGTSEALCLKECPSENIPCSRVVNGSQNTSYSYNHCKVCNDVTSNPKCGDPNIVIGNYGRRGVVDKHACMDGCTAITRITSTTSKDPEAAYGWRIRVSASSTRSGWAWDVQDLRFYTDSGAVKGCAPIHSGSVSDKENGGVAGYEPECALTERGCLWGGRKDAAGMLWLGLLCKDRHDVTKVTIKQPSSKHYADKVTVEISEAGNQPWTAVNISHTTQLDDSTNFFVASRSSPMVPETAVMTSMPGTLTIGGSVSIEAPGTTQTQMELVTQKALALEFDVSESMVVTAAVQSRRLAEATAAKSGNWIVRFNVTFPSVAVSLLLKVGHTVSALKANPATLALKMMNELYATGAGANVYAAIKISSFVAAKVEGMESGTTAAVYASNIAEDVAVSTSAPSVQQKREPRDVRGGISGVAGTRSMYMISAGAVLAFAIRLDAL